jgi:hypothetical protein
LIKNLRRAPARFVFGNTVQPRHVKQVFSRAKVVVETRIFRQIADALFYFKRLMGGVETAHGHIARSGFGESQQHENGGCFARAVRPEKSEDFPFFNSEA